MSSVEEKIILELSKHNKPVSYSTFRESFKESDFLERFCFLVTTGDIMVLGWKNEKSKYPEEAVKINMLYEQYTGESGGIHLNKGNIRRYVGDFLKGPIAESQSKAFEKTDRTKEPMILYRLNWPRMMEWLDSKKESGT